MALPQVLIILSLLPFLEAQNLAHANITGIPINNATLNWLSGKWFYIGSAFRSPEFKNKSQRIQAAFFYFHPNLTEDTVQVHEYHTAEDRCTNESILLRVQRENGTLSRFVGDKEVFANLKVLRKYEVFMLGFFLEDEKNRGLSFYGKKADVTPELVKEFQKAINSVGMDESEITFTDWRKNMCKEDQQPVKLEKTETETEKEP